MTDAPSPRCSSGSHDLRQRAELCAKYDFDTVEMIECKWAIWDEILEALSPQAQASETLDATEQGGRRITPLYASPPAALPAETVTVPIEALRNCGCPADFRATVGQCEDSGQCGCSINLKGRAVSSTNQLPPDWKQDQAETSRLPKVRTGHHRNKEEATRLQALVNKRYKRAYCEFCDKEYRLHHDEVSGFHHVVKGETVPCTLSSTHHQDAAK